MILAGIITYNPNIDRLRENLNSICIQVDSVLIVDNSSLNIDEVEEIVKSYSNIVLFRNATNLGVAKALNIEFQYAVDNGFDWVLTLDQDSVCDRRIVEIYSKYVNLPNIGILTCLIRDRNYGKKFIENYNYEIIDFCITSGSFCNVKAFLKTEGFDTRMFIDCVDFDYCSQLKKNALNIYKINYVGLLHEVGKSVEHHFFGKKLIIYNENEKRHFFMSRNRRYLFFKYKEEKEYKHPRIKEFKERLKIIFYEKKKFKKLINRLKGFSEGKKLYKQYIEGK